MQLSGIFQGVFFLSFGGGLFSCPRLSSDALVDECCGSHLPAVFNVDFPFALTCHRRKNAQPPYLMFFCESSRRITVSFPSHFPLPHAPPSFRRCALRTLVIISPGPGPLARSGSSPVAMPSSKKQPASRESRVQTWRRKLQHAAGRALTHREEICVKCIKHALAANKEKLC